VPLLVDGYNVLFALHLIPKSVGPNVLAKARRTLLDLLVQGLGAKARQVTVIFDAARAPKFAPGDFMHRGIEVVFTKRKQEADDLIEERIADCTHARDLVVVSSDRRLRDAAQKRKATSLRSEDFPAWLASQAEVQATSMPDGSPDKPIKLPLAADVTRQWLHEFAHLVNDPEFHEVTLADELLRKVAEIRDADGLDSA
jgi:predicted RNA-binding protein with PIN domain